VAKSRPVFSFFQSLQASSSIGGAAVSKTAGWGFNSLLACHLIRGDMSQSMQSGSSSAWMDKIKWMFAVALLVAAIVASCLLTHPIGIRWGVLLIGVAGSFGLAKYTEKGRLVWNFCKEARAELRKVVWPTREETMRATFLILGMILVATLLLWTVDSIIWRIVAWVTGFRA